MLDHSLFTRFEPEYASTDHSPAFDSLISNYILACRVEEKSPVTLQSYSQRLFEFSRFARANQFPARLNPNHIRLFLAHLMERGIGPTTLNAYYRCLRTFFNWLIREELLDKSPMLNIKPPKIPKTRPEPFTEEDIVKLLLVSSGNRFVDYRNRALLLMFLDTGLRAEEMSRVKRDDLNMTTGVLKVMGKGKKERVVRAGKRTRLAVVNYNARRTDNLPELWLSENRLPLSLWGVKAAIQDLAKRAEITSGKKGPHRLRHTFGTAAIRNGANVFYVQELLGHSTLTMTRHYASIIDSECAVLKHHEFSPVDNLDQPQDGQNGGRQGLYRSGYS